MSVWAVVTDSRRAHIFDIAKNGAELSEIADFTNISTLDTTAEPKRRHLDRRGGNWHGLTPKNTPQEHEAILFANEISEFLYKEWAAHHFSDLVLIAGPEWLGHVRQALPDSVAATVGRTITKDLIRHSEHELAMHLKSARPLVASNDTLH